MKAEVAVSHLAAQVQVLSMLAHELDAQMTKVAGAFARVGERAPLLRGDATLVKKAVRAIDDLLEGELDASMDEARRYELTVRALVAIWRATR